MICTDCHRKASSSPPPTPPPFLATLFFPLSRSTAHSFLLSRSKLLNSFFLSSCTFKAIKWRTTKIEIYSSLHIDEANLIHNRVTGTWNMLITLGLERNSHTISFIDYFSFGVERMHKNTPDNVNVKQTDGSVRCNKK